MLVSTGHQLTVWCDYDQGDWDLCVWYRPSNRLLRILFNSIIHNSASEGILQMGKSRKNVKVSRDVCPIDLWSCLQQ